MFDKFKEECGLMAVWQHEEASNLTYLGLCGQQHRGQEGAGIVALNRDHEKGPDFTAFKGHGLVQDVFRKFEFVKKLPGKSAVGHVRYTTAGGAGLANVQPFFSNISVGRVALAHNGNLINTKTLRKSLIGDGAIFASESDTEVILHLLARAPRNVPLAESLISALSKIRGAYSLILMFEDRLFLARDPKGLRPLVIGTLDGAKVAASETCAFNLIGAECLREVEPGEIVEITVSGEMKSYFPFEKTTPAPCIFEYVYFSRPDSDVFGRNVYPIRKAMGAELAKEFPVENADMVIPVPDSGLTAAIGYAQEANIPLEYGLIRNHYVGRTFIEPHQSIRDFGVRVKLSANPNVLKDKVVVAVDDSIVRGTTSKKIVKMIRDAGAKEVHLRISAPPTTDPCYYGVDTPEKEKLIASAKTVQEIADYINVDSLAYLSIDGIYRAVNEEQGRMCDACFTGKYPVGTPKSQDRQEELF